jgi:hypothetical protein
MKSTSLSPALTASQSDPMLEILIPCPVTGCGAAGAGNSRPRLGQLRNHPSGQA